MIRNSLLLLSELIFSETAENTRNSLMKILYFSCILICIDSIMVNDSASGMSVEHLMRLENQGC